MSQRLVLLGDSVIDNRAYVQPGEPDVPAQLAALLPGVLIDARATDGAASAEILSEQLRAPLPEGCWAALSAGGNDALNALHLLEDSRPQPPSALLTELHRVREAFRRDYAALLERIAAQGARALVMTIYNPHFAGEHADLQAIAEAGLSLFNDVIQQEALARRLLVLDLRGLCDRAEDFANPIEPSCAGGLKIASAIAALIAPPKQEVA